MGFIVVMGIIIFIIWIFSSGNSNRPGSSSNSNTPSSSENFDRIQRERRQLQEYQEESRRRAEQERQRQENLRRQRPASAILQPNVLRQIRPNQGIVNYKQGWQSFQTVLTQNNITRLFHFTDRANLASIRQHGGLFSWHYCQQNNITIPKPGGSPTSWILDTKKGLQNYVRVSFVRDHPMMFVAQNDGRISNPVILEINPNVVYLASSRYASQNAAKNGVTTHTSLEGLTSIQFPILRRRYFDLSVTEKSYYQAEVLILEKIPIESILNINTV